VANDKLLTHVSNTYPLERVREAHEQVAQGSTTGKVVLEIAG
jgi:NADPH:quinone reductase-like Zn-dependent oxidoreductase